jgi:hypothetical protein
MAQSSISEQKLLRYWRLLGPEQQRTALAFVEFLQHQSTPHQPRKSLLGLLSTVGQDVTSEDISEARKEIWGSFPREM